MPDKHEKRSLVSMYAVTAVVIVLFAWGAYAKICAEKLTRAASRFETVCQAIIRLNDRLTHMVQLAAATQDRAPLASRSVETEELARQLAEAKSLVGYAEVAKEFKSLDNASWELAEIERTAIQKMDQNAWSEAYALATGPVYQRAKLQYHTLLAGTIDLVRKRLQAAADRYQSIWLASSWGGAATGVSLLLIWIVLYRQLQATLDQQTSLKHDLETANRELKQVVAQREQEIVDWERAEHALRMSEERLQMALTATNDGLWDFNLKTHEAYVSPRWYAMLGYDPTEAPPGLAAWRRLLHPSDVDRVVKAWDDYLSGRQSAYEIEYRMQRKNGGYCWILSRGKITDRAADGSPVRIIGTHVDITGRKESENALRQSEERFRSLIQNSSDITTLLNDEGVIQFITPAVSRVLGYQPYELEGRSIYNFLHTDAIGPAKKSLEQVQESAGAVVAVELQFRHKDGSARLLESTLSNMINRAAVGALVCNSRDVTERKQAEKALAESQRKIATLMSNLPGMAYQCLNDPRWTMLVVSEGCYELTGYLAEDLVHNRRAIWSDLIHPDDRESVWTQIQDAVHARRPYQLNYRIRTADRAEKWVWEQGRGVFASDGRLLTLEGFITDVTIRKRAEEELVRYTEELARSNAELEQFAYVSSHDLQEPLRMVSNYVQLLSRRYQDKLDADANEFINFAVEGARRMQQLINDLLMFSRVGTQGKPLQPTDANVVLRHVLDNLKIAIADSGAAITSETLPQVQADEVQLAQLFQNLIGNAIKFRAESAPRIHVGVVRKSAEEWAFSVSDNGIGIAPQYHQRVFVIFQRLHTRSEYPGTGIGLAICKKIVERHGGKIWVESEESQGATFSFTLQAVAPKKNLFPIQKNHSTEPVFR